MKTLVIDYLYGIRWTYKVAHIEGMDRVWPRFDYIGYSVTVTYAWLACSGSPAAGSKKKRAFFVAGIAGLTREPGTLNVAYGCIMVLIHQV